MRPASRRDSQYWEFDEYDGSRGGSSRGSYDDYDPAPGKKGYSYDPTPKKPQHEERPQRQEHAGPTPYPMNNVYGGPGPPGGGYYFAPGAAMYPPGMMAAYMGQPMDPIKSKVPTTGMIMGILAAILGIIPMIFSIYAFIVPPWRWAFDDEIICLGILFLYAAIVTLATLGIVFSSIAVYGISTKRYKKTPTAVTGLVLSIIGGSLFLISFCMFFVGTW